MLSVCLSGVLTLVQKLPIVSLSCSSPCITTSRPVHQFGAVRSIDCLSPPRNTAAYVCILPTIPCYAASKGMQMGEGAGMATAASGGRRGEGEAVKNCGLDQQTSGDQKKNHRPNFFFMLSLLLLLLVLLFLASTTTALDLTAGARERSDSRNALRSKLVSALKMRENVRANLQEGIQATGKDFIDWFDGVINVIENAGEAVWGAVEQEITPVISTIQQEGASIVNTIGNEIVHLANGAVQVSSLATGEIVTIAEDAVADIENGVMTVYTQTYQGIDFTLVPFCVGIANEIKNGALLSISSIEQFSLTAANYFRYDFIADLQRFGNMVRGWLRFFCGLPMIQTGLSSVCSITLETVLCVSSLGEQGCESTAATGENTGINFAKQLGKDAASWPGATVQTCGIFIALKQLFSSTLCDGILSGIAMSYHDAFQMTAASDITGMIIGEACNEAVGCLCGAIGNGDSSGCPYQCDVDTSEYPDADPLNDEICQRILSQNTQQAAQANQYFNPPAVPYQPYYLASSTSSVQSCFNLQWGPVMDGPLPLYRHTSVTTYCLVQSTDQAQLVCAHGTATNPLLIFMDPSIFTNTGNCGFPVNVFFQIGTAPAVYRVLDSLGGYCTVPSQAAFARFGNPPVIVGTGVTGMSLYGICWFVGDWVQGNGGGNAGGIPGNGLVMQITSKYGDYCVANDVTLLTANGVMKIINQFIIPVQEIAMATPPGVQTVCSWPQGFSFFYYNPLGGGGNFFGVITSPAGDFCIVPPSLTSLPTMYRVNNVAYTVLEGVPSGTQQSNTCYFPGELLCNGASTYQVMDFFGSYCNVLPAHMLLWQPPPQPCRTVNNAPEPPEAIFQGTCAFPMNSVVSFPSSGNLYMMIVTAQGDYCQFSALTWPIWQIVKNVTQTFAIPSLPGNLVGECPFYLGAVFNTVESSPNTFQITHSNGTYCPIVGVNPPGAPVVQLPSLPTAGVDCDSVFSATPQPTFNLIKVMPL